MAVIKVSIFFPGIYFSTLRRGLFPTMENCTLHLFFLIFLFPSDLSIHYDCCWWCFPQEFRFDCFCQGLSDIILVYQRQEEKVGSVLFIVVCRTKALLKCVLFPDKKI